MTGKRSSVATADTVGVALETLRIHDHVAMSPAAPVSRTHETELLILCGTRRVRAVDVPRLRSCLNTVLDWRYLLNEANRHGLLALLHSNLKELKVIDQLPDDARQALESATRQRAARSLELLGELVRILQWFAKANVPAMPFKGPVVSKVAYGDFLLRSYCDLDILVREQDLEKARSILVEGGYRDTHSLSPREERSYRKTECAVQMRDERRDFVVELHWRFSERNASIALPVDALWRRADSIALAGAEVPSLSREDLILYLCVHGAKHHWERLEWISCLAEIVRVQEVDWSAVLQRADQYRIARLLHLGMHLVQMFFAVDLPNEVGGRVKQDATARSLAEWVAGRMFSGVTHASHYQHRATRYVFLLRTREHWADKFRILFYSAVRSPHPDAEEWLKLPPHFAFLHHIIRPVRLISQYSAVAWRHYSSQRDGNRT